jgi:hypothetical protein
MVKNTFPIPVGPYVAHATRDEADQLLLLFTEHGHDVCGFVIKDWEQAGEWSVAASVGHVPSNIEWGLVSAVGTARNAHNEGLIPAGESDV